MIAPDDDELCSPYHSRYHFNVCSQRFIICYDVSTDLTDYTKQHFRPACRSVPNDTNYFDFSLFFFDLCASAGCYKIDMFDTVCRRHDLKHRVTSILQTILFVEERSVSEDETIREAERKNSVATVCLLSTLGVRSLDQGQVVHRHS